jgi:23S rRNA (cytosine1962-C5)-methyltransferase
MPSAPGRTKDSARTPAGSNDPAASSGKARALPARPVAAGALRLTKALERVVHEGHPWVFAEALEGDATPGAVTTLLDRGDGFLARGIAEEGAIGLRVWTNDRREALDATLVRARLELAARLRERMIDDDTSAYRLVHGEGDRLPGVVVDVYAATEAAQRYAVMRFDGAVSDASFVRDALIAWLRERGIDTLLHKHGRKGETRVDVVFGEAPREILAVRERGMTLLADLMHGQKTGLFLDHRESRFRVRQLARGLRVLNLYAYTGGFSIAAGLGGADHVTTVDVAPNAVALADEGWRRNGLDSARHRAVAADVPTFLADDEARFDLIVADPPSFAPSERATPAALEAYTKLHASCLARLELGGSYLAASCSSHVRGSDFEATLREGARKARKRLQVLDRWGGAPDHPRLIAFPEGDYLDCVLTRVVG